MVDVFEEPKRRYIMSRVGSRDTAPEVAVRSIVHRLGYRFRKHRSDLPGNPDIVLTRHRTVIFVHGCFWHGHPGCKRAARPSSNTGFWHAKLDANIRRDRRNQRKLRQMGWKVMVVWQCRLRDKQKLTTRIKRFLER